MVAMETIMFIYITTGSVTSHSNENVAILSLNICSSRHDNKYVFKYNINVNMCA